MSTTTHDLLLRWHQGDQDALAELVEFVEQDSEWIEARVRRRLGPLLRAWQDTHDIVQMTLTDALRNGPRFLISDRGHFRALLARMVENTLRNRADHDCAARRDVRRDVRHDVRRDGQRDRPRDAPRQAALPRGDTLITLDLPATATAPDEAAARSETQTWVRLALELLDPEDREIVVLRQYQELAFAEIGLRLGIAEAAARMRFDRALLKLGRKLEWLRAGDVGRALGESA